MWPRTISLNQSSTEVMFFRIFTSEIPRLNDDQQTYLFKLLASIEAQVARENVKIVTPASHQHGKCGCPTEKRE